MGAVTHSDKVRPKEVGWARLMDSAKVIDEFADAVLANPGEFQTLGKAGLKSKADRHDMPTLVERLRRKLGQVEVALSKSKEAVLAAAKPTAKPRAGATSRGVAHKTRTLQQLRQQAREAMATRVEDGTLIPVKVFIEERKFTKQAMSKAVGANRVFSLVIDGDTYVPAFYTDPQQDVKKLEKVSKVLGDLPGASKLHFFTSGWGSLGGKTPLEALAQGQFESVMNTAQGFAEG